VIVAYDKDGLVLATVDRVYDDKAKHDLADEEFVAMQLNGMPLARLNRTHGAKGSKVWIGDLPPGILRAELAGPPGAKELVALVNVDTGERRLNGL